jgi:dihydrofolate synthase/folylpolyglutamate synthase
VSQDTSVAEVYRAVERSLLSRWGEQRIDPSLEPMRVLCDVLGDPQHTYPSIHLTGTNGKTSTARMIDALLRAINLRVGRYTSPHVTSMTERISLDGAPIDQERFVRTHEELLPFVEIAEARIGHRLSFFAVMTAMAFAAFADAPVDVAVVEVGLGGSWDYTNVVDGKVAVVTPIGVDHASMLGETPEEIAVEKGGIIKPGGIAVLAQQPVEAAMVLLRRAAEVGATVSREGIEFGVLERNLAVGGQHLTLRGLAGEYPDIYLPLHGAHQAQNAACALAAVEAFLGTGTGGAELDADLVREAFAQVTSPGRLEVMRRSPTVIIDAAHNPAGAEVTARAITEEFGFSRLVGVLGVMADKDAQGILEIFEPIMAEVVVTQNSLPRAMPAAELAELAEGVFGSDRVTAVPRLDEAIDRAIGLADALDSADMAEFALGNVGVLVTGSVVTIGEARTLLATRAAKEG